MRNIITQQQLDDLEHAYSYHAATTAQLAQYHAINEAAMAFERAVLENCPASADRTFACRQIRDARMTANRSIALHRESDSCADEKRP
jgi:hypothetical protein